MVCAAANLLRTKPVSFPSPRRPACPAWIWTAARSARARRTPSSKYVAEERHDRAARDQADRASEIANGGGTPLLVAETAAFWAQLHLKDIVKGGMRERFDHLRAMGIRTVMITGDNPLTAAAIARQAASMIFSPKPSRKTRWR